MYKSLSCHRPLMGELIVLIDFDSSKILSGRFDITDDLYYIKNSEGVYIEIDMEDNLYWCNSQDFFFMLESHFIFEHKKEIQKLLKDLKKEGDMKKVTTKKATKKVAKKTTKKSQTSKK